jgi:hypothetical protein
MTSMGVSTLGLGTPSSRPNSLSQEESVIRIRPYTIGETMRYDCRHSDCNDEMVYDAPSRWRCLAIIVMISIGNGVIGRL